jgi:hypothetical protein
MKLLSHIQRAAFATEWSSRGPQLTNPFNGAVASVIERSSIPAIRSLRLARGALLLLHPVGSAERPPACAQCGAPVRDDDPFIRYHGEYYHAHGCLENHPPAERRRRILAAQTSN